MQLPPEAQVESGIVQAAGGQPLTQKPTPGGQRGRYHFPVFPLRPGETRFAASYRMPYRGEAVIEPKILYPLRQFAVVLPRSMKFEAGTPGIFQPMRGQATANVLVTAAVKPGQRLAFRVSGTGTLVAVEGGQQPAPRGNKVRPPSAQQAVLHYRWFMLGGLGLVLAAAAAGLLAHKRKQPRHLSV